MKKLFLITASIFSFTISAQNQKSIYQLENDFYSEKFSVNPVPKTFEQPQINKIFYNQTLSKTVFGFLPWWEYKAGSHKNLRFDLLSHIAVFSFEADSAGNLKDPVGWPWIDVINSARNNGVKIIMTVTNFNPDDIHKLLVDIGIRDNLFENIRTRLVTQSLDGVNIDFENVRDEDKPFAVKIFFEKLRDYLSQTNPGFEISFASPVVNFGGWDFRGIAEFCNYLFVMGYDFYGSWSSTTGPSAPLTGTFYNLTKSFEEDYNSIVNSNSDKLIFGVPYYGNYWRTNSKDAYVQVTPYDSTKGENNWVKPFLRYKDIFPTHIQKEKVWDTISQTPWLRWQDSTWNQIWYDNDSSLALKYDFAIKKNLKGIGIWALGYDDSKTELWKLIERKFGKPTNVERDIADLPGNFELLQNYPNPFNPSTVISYQLSVAGHVTLKVYDLLGREVAILVNEEQQPGNYKVNFNGQKINDQRQLSSGVSAIGGYASGVYFYRLIATANSGQAGSYSSTKKMLLHK